MSLEELPPNLPVPIDDGACDHLIGLELPDIVMPSTNGGLLRLSEFRGLLVIYCYPKTGRPGVPLPEGWDSIPGARGCTPHSCAFRDHYAELQDFDADVVGLSTQTTDYQREMVERLHLPFPVLSDQGLEFTRSLNLPTFEVDGEILLKRVTLISEDRRIIAVHYPVFPSSSDPTWVLNFLKSR